MSVNKAAVLRLVGEGQLGENASRVAQQATPTMDMIAVSDFIFIIIINNIL